MLLLEGDIPASRQKFDGKRFKKQKGASDRLEVGAASKCCGPEMCDRMCRWRFEHRAIQVFDDAVVWYGS
jgi:hypothetical protein